MNVCMCTCVFIMCVYIYICRYVFGSVYIMRHARVRVLQNVELGVECCRFGSWSCVLKTFVVRAVHCRGFLSRPRDKVCDKARHRRDKAQSCSAHHLPIQSLTKTSRVEQCCTGNIMSHERLSLHPFRRHANNQNAPAACCDKTEASFA